VWWWWNHQLVAHLQLHLLVVMCRPPTVHHLIIPRLIHLIHLHVNLPLLQLHRLVVLWKHQLVALLQLQLLVVM